MARPADAIGVILASLLFLLQQSSPAPVSIPTDAPQTKPAPARLGVELDKNGWPVSGASRSVADAKLAQPFAKESPRDGVPDRQPVAAAPVGETAPQALSAVWDRMSLTVGSTDAFHSLGALRIEWRVRVLGADGKTLGERIVRQVSDSAYGDRERLEFDDGRVYARLDGAVQAERHGMPWPTLEAAAGRELAMFAMHAAMPWRLVDPSRYVDAGAPRPAGVGGAVVFPRIPRPAKDEVGPSAEKPRGEVVELVVDAANGALRELVMAADVPTSRRRVLLEDWRPWNGLLVPFRRTWLDAEGHPATTLEIVRIEAGIRATDKDFRLR